MQRTVCCQIHCLHVLFKEEFTALKYDDLLLNREMAFNSLSITEDQAKQIETTTCDQVHYKLWFRYRAVCVTASKFKAAASTDQSQPSQLLLKAICYHESFKFNTAVTRWGCEHEKTVRDAYIKKATGNHLHSSVRDRGLVIHPQFPHFGATPDGFVKCDCCGCGVVEVKCHFSCTDRSFYRLVLFAWILLKMVNSNCWSVN